MRYFIVILFCILSLFLRAQANKTDSVKTDTSLFNLYPLPVVYYTPETRFAFGGVAICSFRFKGKFHSERNSLFQLGAAYTQENQLLFYLPFQLFLSRNRYNISGELGYYRYSYYFYGVGSTLPIENEELYYVNFPRFRLNATKLIRKNLYVGLRYWFDDYKLKKLAEGGILQRQEVAGSRGGIISSPGLIGIFDSRDNYNYPSQGSFLQVLVQSNQAEFGSDFSFNRYSIDFSKYLSIKESSIFAFNFYGVSLFGTPPFNELAFIGGREKMRGYYEGRFRDKNLLMAQTEFRQYLFGKWGMVAFMGSGIVAPSIETYQINDMKISGGLGIRYYLNEEDKVNIRLDYGIGERGSSGFYLTIGEAF